MVAPVLLKMVSEEVVIVNNPVTYMVDSFRMAVGLLVKVTPPMYIGPV